MKKLILILILALATEAVFASSLDEAISLSMSGRDADARTLLEGIVKQEPQNARAHHALGQIAARQGDWAQAAQQFERAMECDPKFSDAVRDLGGACLAQAQKSNSLFQALRGRKLLKRAVELAPENSANQQAFIQFYRNAPFFIGGGRSKAYAQIEELRKADHFAGAMTAAEMRFEDKDWARCFAELDRAAKLKPEDHGQLLLTMRAVADSGLNHERGVEAGKALLAQPDQGAQQRGRVLTLAGRIAEARGETPAALANYREAVALDQTAEDAKTGLVRIEGIAKDAVGAQAQ